MITITKDNKYFNLWRLALSAYDKKHKDFGVIKFTSKKVIVTDGKRLHRVEIDNNHNKAGYYDVLKNSTKEIQLEYCENQGVSCLWSKVEDLFDCQWDKEFKVHRPNPNFYMEILMTLGPYGYGIDVDHLKPLEKYATEWTIRFNSKAMDVGEQKQIYFCREYIEVLLMPFRNHDVEVRDI